MPLLWKKGYVFPNYTSSSCPIELGPHKSVRDCIIRTPMTKIWFLSFSCCEYFKTGRSCAAESWHYRFSVCQSRCSKPSNACTSKGLGCDGGTFGLTQCQRYNSIVGAPVPFLWHYTCLPEETSHWSGGTHTDGGNSASSKTQRVQVVLQEGPSCREQRPAPGAALAAVHGGVKALTTQRWRHILTTCSIFVLAASFPSSTKQRLEQRQKREAFETWVQLVLSLWCFSHRLQHFTSSSSPSVSLSSTTPAWVWIVILGSNTSSNLHQIKIYWPMVQIKQMISHKLLCLAPAPSIDRSTKPPLDRLAPPYERESPGSGQYLLTFISLGLL